MPRRSRRQRKRSRSSSHGVSGGSEGFTGDPTTRGDPRQRKRQRGTAYKAASYNVAPLAPAGAPTGAHRQPQRRNPRRGVRTPTAAPAAAPHNCAQCQGAATGESLTPAMNAPCARKPRSRRRRNRRRRRRGRGNNRASRAPPSEGEHDQAAEWSSSSDSVNVPAREDAVVRQNSEFGSMVEVLEDLRKKRGVRGAHSVQSEDVVLAAMFGWSVAPTASKPDLDAANNVIDEMLDREGLLMPPHSPMEPPPTTANPPAAAPSMPLPPQLTSGAEPRTPTKTAGAAIKASKPQQPMSASKRRRLRRLRLAALRASQLAEAAAREKQPATTAAAAATATTTAAAAATATATATATAAPPGMVPPDAAYLRDRLAAVQDGREPRVAAAYGAAQGQVEREAQGLAYERGSPSPSPVDPLLWTPFLHSPKECPKSPRPNAISDDDDDDASGEDSAGALQGMDLGIDVMSASLAGIGATFSTMEDVAKAGLIGREIVRPLPTGQRPADAIDDFSVLGGAASRAGSLSHVLITRLKSERAHSIALEKENQRLRELLAASGVSVQDTARGETQRGAATEGHGQREAADALPAAISASVVFPEPTLDDLRPPTAPLPASPLPASRHLPLAPQPSSPLEPPPASAAPSA